MHPSSAEDWVHVDHHFPIDHPAGPGHFPGNPIIPGALLLDHALRLSFGPDTGVPQIQVVKFLQPVRPGDHVRFRWRTDSGGLSIECRMIEGNHLLLSASLKLGIAS
ncbi:MAG TPA: hypothetical protein VL574_15415 [Stellaceae bacterium]|jgi:3-hydroxymyristoyl/3-hydroxydecanoyl-(acyl carrier protein) dehydratase|nr:hypothetical protein [Stellaceae bacterium]